MFEWLYLIILIVSLLASVVLTGVSWFHRDTPGGQWFTLSLLVATIIIAAYLFFSISTQESTVFFWVRLRLTGLSLIAPPLLAFVLAYTENEQWIRRLRYIVGGLVVPSITTFFIWFMPDLLWRSWTFSSPHLINIESPVFNIWFYVHSIYSVGLVLVACVLIAQHAMLTTRFSRRQAWSILIGILITLTMVLLPTLGLTRGMPNPSPIGLAFLFVMLSWAFLREELLRLSPLSYQTILENMLDIIFVVDTNDNVLLMNDPAQQLFGLHTLSDSIGQNIRQIFGEQAMLIIGQSEHDHKSFEVEIQVDGSLRIFDIRVSPILNSKVHGEHRLFVMRDITSRKHMEDELRESEEIFRSLTELSPIGIFVQRNNEILYTNQTINEMMHVSHPEQLIGKNMMDFVHDDYKEDVIRKMGFAFETSSKLDLSERIVLRPDHTEFFAETTSQRIMYDGEPALMGVVLDITSRKHMEDELRESETRQKSLLSAIPDLIFRNHRDGTYLDYHAANTDILLMPPDQFIGRNIKDVLPPEIATQHLKYIEQVIETGEQQIYEYDLPLNDQKMTFEARTVVFGEDEVLSIMRDVTEQKKMQERIFELALERERRQLLTTFIENAAHEFRTPLATIGTSAYIMSRSDDLNRRQIKATQIKLQIERINRLVDNLMLMVMLERNDVLSTASVDLGEILTLVCQDFAKMYDNQLDLHYQIAPDLPTVVGEATYLKDAFHQLLDNACRYTPDGGTIKVTTGTENDRVWIEIHNTGQGISSDVMPHIFESFWRQDDAHTTQGFGLGLPIVQKIIDRHGGEISVESEVGKSTRFRIIL